MTSPLFGSSGRKFVAGASLAAVLVAQGMMPAGAATDTPQSQPLPIRFKAQVPVVKEPLPLYKLTPTAAPMNLITQRLTALKAPSLRMERELYVARASETEALHAYVNPATGDAALLPNLSRIVTESTAPAFKAPLAPERAQSIARTLFANTTFIPKDVTTLRIAPAIAVEGGAQQRPTKPGMMGAITAPSVRFTFVPAMRYASGLPVYGMGSRAVVTLANDGSVRGLVRRWRSAAQADRIAPTMSAEAVQNAIRTQLKSFVSAHTQITVDRIAQAYYDGNAKYLQPVYYFSATLHPVSGRIADDHVIGYVPIGRSAEPIPTIGTPNGPAPTEPKNAIVPIHMVPKAIVPQAGGPTPITLGEYANRDGAMLDMANDLLTGLSIKLPFISPSTPIVRTQWYWAYPWEVVGASSHSYMNAVNIAYTQPHGDWYINTTYSNYADLWDVRSIGVGGNPGYGAAAGGKLATWIIDSCEVVPSYYDLQVSAGNGGKAFTPWFPVFQGLHNVLGFRTQMWLHDGLNEPFGFLASLGGDLNSAWFQEIAADPAYNDGYTYLDTHLNQMVHMGRASTFIDARNLGQSIYNVAPQSAAGTLWNFWMNN